MLLISTLTGANAGLSSAIQNSSSAFCKVDYLDANSGTTPTVAFLSQYGAVLAYNDDTYPYSDPAGLGDALAAYFNAGGRVVIALFADAGYPIGGAFAADNYLVLQPVNAPEASDSFSASNSAQDVIPTSPILNGVMTIAGTGWRGAQIRQNGGVAVANWASGEPLAVVGTVTDARGKLRKVVDLNILPTDISTGAWTGDGSRSCATRFFIGNLGQSRDGRVLRVAVKYQPEQGRKEVGMRDVLLPLLACSAPSHVARHVCGAPRPAQRATAASLRRFAPILSRGTGDRVTAQRVIKLPGTSMLGGLHHRYGFLVRGPVPRGVPDLDRGRLQLDRRTRSRSLQLRVPPQARH